MEVPNLAPSHLKYSIVSGLNSIPGDDLVTLDTTQFPDGALCWVVDRLRLYVLYKHVTLTPNNASIMAAVGGGTWVALTDSSANASWSSYVRLAATTGTPSTGALTQNTWTALPSGVGQYGSQGALSANWTINTTTGVMTYAGPIFTWAVYGSITCVPGTGTDVIAGFSVSPSNGVIIGQVTAQDIESQAEADTATSPMTMSFNGVVSNIPDGGTLQGVIRNISGTEALTILRYQMIVTPLP